MYIDSTEMRRVQHDMLWEQGRELGGKEERQKDGSYCHYLADVGQCCAWHERVPFFNNNVNCLEYLHISTLHSHHRHSPS